MALKKEIYFDFVADIKSGKIKNALQFKVYMKKYRINDMDFINMVKEYPDADMLDWLDDQKTEFDGIGLINSAWMKRNIDKRKIAPADYKRLGI